MAAQADVRRIALSLPGTSAVEGRFAFSVPHKKKQRDFLWVWQERIDPKKARVPQPKVLALRVGDLQEKELLLSSDKEKFFTEPHYDGFPAVLVRLPAVTVQELKALITQSWHTQVPQVRRCGWANGDALMAAYHDEEWGVPQRDPRMLWEMLMLEGFQAGLSWSIVLRKRDAFRKAFAGFDPKKVARFGAKDIQRLMSNAGIIRARAKIEATIRGAQLYCEMEDFSDFCWSFTGGKVLKGDGKTRVVSSPLSEEISKAMKARGFKFVGPTIVYAWMQAVGIVNDHSTGCFRRA